MPMTKITVVSQNVTRQADDGSWQLSELVATDQHGLPITKTLKTFERGLPVNQLIDVEVEQNSNPKYADEYMVSLPGSKRGGGGGGGGSQVTGRVDLLEEQMASLNTRVGALEGRMDAATSSATAAGGGTGFEQPKAAPAPADDDIPF